MESLKEHPTIPLPCLWTPRLDYNAPFNKDDFSKLITRSSVFDFGRINKKTLAFEALPRKVASSDIDIKRKGTAKYHLEISAENYISPKRHVVVVSWDGTWNIDPKQVQLEIKVE